MLSTRVTHDTIFPIQAVPLDLAPIVFKCLNPKELALLECASKSIKMQIENIEYASWKDQCINQNIPLTRLKQVEDTLALYPFPIKILNLIFEYDQSSFKELAQVIEGTIMLTNSAVAIFPSDPTLHLFCGVFLDPKYRKKLQMESASTSLELSINWIEKSNGISESLIPLKYFLIKKGGLKDTLKLIYKGKALIFNCLGTYSTFLEEMKDIMDMWPTDFSNMDHTLKSAAQMEGEWVEADQVTAAEPP